MNNSTTTKDCSKTPNLNKDEVVHDLIAVRTRLEERLGQGLDLSRQNHRQGLVEVSDVLREFLDMVEHAVRVTSTKRPHPPGYLHRDCSTDYYLDGVGPHGSSPYTGERIGTVLRRVREIRHETGRTPEVTGWSDEDRVIAWWRDVVEWDRRIEAYKAGTSHT